MGSATVTVEVPKGASCEDVLRRLAELEPRLGKLLFSEGVLRDHLHVFVNGENVNHREGLRTKLSDGDVLTFFTPISGGELQPLDAASILGLRGGGDGGSLAQGSNEKIRELGGCE